MNSWNEWGEGAHLEPDRQNGRTFLDAVRRVVAGDPSAVAESDLHLNPGYAGRTSGELVARLEAENRLLVGRLHQLGGLVGGQALERGFPKPLANSARVTLNGVGWVDRVNGRATMVQRVRAPLAGALWMQGWFYGDSKRSGRPDGFAYLVLTDIAGGEQWTAPIPTRLRRDDVRRSISAGGRVRRRLAREVDRLPPKVARAINRAWVGSDDWFGFDVQLDARSLDPGVYRVGFVEIIGQDVVNVTTDFELEIQG